MKMIESEKLWKKGQRLIINGTSLFSRGPRINVDGVAPKYCKEASGCYFTDVDDDKFLDYGMGVGAVILGWGRLQEYINIRSGKGNNTTILSPLQVEMAEEIVKNIPSCKRMKFLSTGSEATETAVRIARAFTGRDKVIRDHYHGWISWCAPVTGGIPKCYSDLSIQEQSTDIEKFKKLLEGDDVACVILEPANAIETTKDKRQQFLTSLKNECKKHDTLLVFDEVACSYRFGVGGAQSFLGVYPDVSAFGKSIANGYPFSFVGCNEEIGNDVENKIFVSSTFGGNALSLEACLRTTDIVKTEHVDNYLVNYGQNLKESINTISEEYGMNNIIRLEGFPNRMTWIQKDWNMVSLLFQEFIRHNIFFAWEIKNSFCHNEEEFNNTIESFQDVIKICKRARDENKVLEYLEGKPMSSIL